MSSEECAEMVGYMESRESGRLTKKVYRRDVVEEKCERVRTEMEG